MSNERKIIEGTTTPTITTSSFSRNATQHLQLTQGLGGLGGLDQVGHIQLSKIQALDLIQELAEWVNEERLTTPTQ